MAQRRFHQYDHEPTGKAGFEALLKVKNLAAANETEPPEDWGRIQREEWLHYLEVLYKQVQAALEPYVVDKQVAIDFRPLTLVEEYVGEYTVEKMLIKFANTEIVLEPVGTMLIGAKGRVDVIGPFGKTPLMLLNNKARRLSDMFQFKINIGNKPAPQLPSSQQSAEPISWEWRIVSKSLDRELISLNEEVILGLFTEIANG